MDFYKKEPFINIMPLGETAQIKDVKYTNNCNISLHLSHNKKQLIIISVIDNMLKGAAGQALQNMEYINGF